MSSHATMHACPVRTFLAAISAKWSRASGERTDWCGPRATASQISSFDHGRPVFVGYPIVAHSASKPVAGCFSALPVGHIEFLYSCVSGDINVVVSSSPRCVVHCDVSVCVALRVPLCPVFSLRSFALFSYQTTSPVSMR